jgi:DNA-binding NarL/FixJ family response regulator
VRNPRRRLAGTTPSFAVPRDMASGRPPPAYDRVVERRRAVALARHFRETEGLSHAQIAVRLGRSPATIKAYE